MKKLKLRGYVLPTIYLLAITTIVISIVFIGQTIKGFNGADEEIDYVTGAIIDNSEPVQQVKNDRVILPFTNEGVEIVKDFYEREATEEEQKKSLIYYEGTYMQNSGILYKAAEEFDVVATMDGIVTNIKEDNLLGVIVEIDHNSKLTTVYQSLKEAKVTVGQAVKQGEVIGVSGPNSIDNSSKFELLFEVCHNGKLINPKSYYNTEIKTYAE